MASNAKTILFPNSLPELTTAIDLCRDSKNLSEVRHILTAPKLSTANYAFSGTALAGETTIPVYQALTSATYFFSDNLPLTKVNFTGNAAVSCNYNSFLNNNKKMQEIIYPSVFGTTVSTYSASNALKKVKLPDTILTGSILNVTGYLNTGSPNLEEVTGDYDNSAVGSAGALTINYQPLALKIWNTPKLRCDSIRIGFAGAAYFYSVLEVFEVDWINSPWVGSPGIAIQFYANVNAAWINALFAKLPTVTGGQKIDMINCTGYPTCDPSIATAKGWTVL